MECSNVYKFHAYIDEDSKRSYSLVKHLLNTYIVVRETSLNNRFGVVAKKIASDKSDEEYLMKLFYTIPLLHDIGKLMELYQTRPHGYNCGYMYHEVVSGIIASRLLYNTNVLSQVKNLRINEVKWCLLTYPIVLHHYAMDRLKKMFKVGKCSIITMFNRWRKFFRVGIEDILCVLMEFLNNEYVFKDEFLTKIIKSMINNVRADTEKSSSRELRIDNNLLSLFIRELDNNMRICNRLSSFVTVLTGLTAIADYATGSLERGRGVLRGYVKYIFKDSEIDYLKKIIIV